MSRVSTTIRLKLMGFCIEKSNGEMETRKEARCRIVFEADQRINKHGDVRVHDYPAIKKKKIVIKNQSDSLHPGGV